MQLKQLIDTHLVVKLAQAKETIAKLQAENKKLTELLEKDTQELEYLRSKYFYDDLR